MTTPINFTIIETGLYSKLTSAAGTVLWGTRVYADQAPAAPTFPYLVFFHVAGGEENVNPAGSFDVLYQVECWGTVLSDARSGQAYLGSALHHQTLSLAGGYTNFWTVQQDFIRTVENVEGKQYWRRGATYRIRGA